MWNHHGRDRRCTIMSVTNVYGPPDQRPMVRHLVGLWAYTNRYRARSVRVYVGNGSLQNRPGEYPSISAEIIGTLTRRERVRDRASVCNPSLAGLRTPFK